MSLRLVIIALVAGTLLASSVALVYVQHLRRSLVVELKGLQSQREALEVEWGRLQLEASTWAAQDRIEQIASKKLGLRVPEPTEVVVVSK